MRNIEYFAHREQSFLAQSGTTLVLMVAIALPSLSIYLYLSIYCSIYCSINCVLSLPRSLFHSPTHNPSPRHPVTPIPTIAFGNNLEGFSTRTIRASTTGINPNPPRPRHKIDADNAALEKVRIAAVGPRQTAR